MPTEIEVANLALERIGSNSIMSLDDPNIEARTVKRELEQSRLYLLRHIEWNFAAKWVQLDTPSNDIVLPQFDYVFRAPADMIMIRGLKYPKSGGSASSSVDIGLDPIRRWQRVGQYIGTNYSQPVVEYTWDCPIGHWDGSAAEALAWRVASQIAIPLARSADTKNMAIAEYSTTLQFAQNVDGREGVQDRLVTDNRLTGARRRGGGVGRAW